MSHQFFGSWLMIKSSYITAPLYNNDLQGSIHRRDEGVAINSLCVQSCPLALIYRVRILGLQARTHQLKLLNLGEIRYLNQIRDSIELFLNIKSRFRLADKVLIFFLEENPKKNLQKISNCPAYKVPKEQRLCGRVECTFSK